MKRVSALLIVTALTVGVALPASAAPPTSNFAGGWTSTDPFDNSNQALVLIPVGGNRLSAILYDDGASVCGTPLTPVLAIGEGRATGSTYSVTFSLFCFNGTSVPDAPVTYTYNRVTDTLSDDFGAVWSRA